MIADIQNRIDSLSKSKKLPKNLDKAKLENAKNGLDEVSKAWDEANQDSRRGALPMPSKKRMGGVGRDRKDPSPQPTALCNLPIAQ